MLCCKLLGLSAGCFSHGEVEDSNPRGPDILPYACAAWDAGCLYQVGYVCRECQMQSVSQERYATPRLRNGWTLSPLHALLRQRAPVVITLSLAVFWVLTIRIYTLRSIDLTEAFDPDFNKPFWWNWYGELQNIIVLLSPGYSGYLDTGCLQILLWELLCHCPFLSFIYELEWSVGI